MKKVVGRVLAGGAALVCAAALLVQLVPYGRAHTNPPVTQEPAWDSPRTRELAQRACFDCHSNETAWPAYASVAPFSWIVQDHVDEGRSVLNFSEFDRPQDEAEEAAEVVLEGEMPLWDYALMHPSARLSPEETRALADGLAATLGGEGGDGEVAAREGRGGRAHGEREDGEREDD
jgi:mono/diheme cytochrome c family protein